MNSARSCAILFSYRLRRPEPFKKGASSVSKEKTSIIFTGDIGFDRYMDRKWEDENLLSPEVLAFFHSAEHLAAHKLPNPFVRIAVGGALVLGLTLIVGDHRFNGAGMDMALAAVAGKTDWYNFLLKMLFTAVTLAAGFKGGEIVPTFCVGATFGCLLGGLLGLDAGICGALGLIGLFCCATNSPIASIVLSIEMFGGANLYVFALVCVICFVLSGNSGLYASQIIQFDKADLKENHLDRMK